MNNSIIREDRYYNKKFFPSNYCFSLTCGLCWYKMHLLVYPLLQWLSLMYHDDNVYLSSQTCEYCGEPFNIFEKLVFPSGCK